MNDNSTVKIGFIRQYWPQLTGILGALIFLTLVYGQFRTLQQEFVDFQRATQERNAALIARIEKAIDILNDEDDGVRGDFEAADAAQDKLEEMRDRATQAELKVWTYENFEPK